MIMIQECSKNINKLEFRHSAKKQVNGGKDEESPSKPVTKATVCLVDLSKRDDTPEDLKLRQPLSENEEEDPASDHHDSDEQSKNIPNHSKHKEISPFK